MPGLKDLFNWNVNLTSSTLNGCLFLISCFDVVLDLTNILWLWYALFWKKFLPLVQISMLVGRNERESAQIALRPKVSWAGDGNAGNLQVHCSDLCSSSGQRWANSIEIELIVFWLYLAFTDWLTFIPYELQTLCNGSEQAWSWEIFDFETCGTNSWSSWCASPNELTQCTD